MQQSDLNTITQKKTESHVGVTFGKVTLSIIKLSLAQGAIECRKGDNGV